MVPRLVGAGVLCAAKDPHGDIVLLLGREREILNWKYGSSKWCSFSGRAEEGEDALSTATREFVEESCSMVRLQEEATLPCLAKDVAWCLKQALPAQKLIRSVHPDEGMLSHVTFLCRVPFDDTLSSRFAEVHQRLSRANVVFKEYQRTKKACDALPRSFMPGFAFGEHMFTVGLSVEDPEGTVAIEILDGAHDQVYTWTFRLSNKACQEAKAVSGAWKCVETFVAQEQASGILGHPALILNFERTRLVSAFVDRSFLEKTDLAWFKLSSLEDASTLKGREQFKTHFLEAVRSFSPMIRSLFLEDHIESRSFQGTHGSIGHASICVH